MKKLFLSGLIFSAGLILYPSDTITDDINSKIQLFFEDMENQKNENKTIYEKKEADTQKNKITPDLLYEIRIEELNKTTPVELVYNNQVKRFIEIYTGRRKREFEKILGLTELYFPIFEEKLDKYNLPLELKYLAVVESSLNPLAVSPSGAVGLWQFLYNTSSMFDLEINSYIDERRDR